VFVATVSLLQLAANAGISPALSGAVEAMIVADELASVLPVTVQRQREYSYTRRLSVGAAQWVAPGAAITATAGPRYGRVLAECRKIVAQPSITPEDAARAGGAEAVHGALAASAFTAISREIARVTITGSSAPTAALDPGSPLAVAGGVTALVPSGQWDLDLGGLAQLRYTTAGGGTFRYRGPGDVEFGEPVVIPASSTGTVVSANGELRLTITRGATALTTATTSVVTVTRGAAEPDGLYQLLAPHASRWLYAGTNGGPITFELLDELLDMCRGDGMRVLVTSHRGRRAIRKLLRDRSAETFTDVGSRKTVAYDGVPVLATEYVPTNRERGTSGPVCTSVFALTLGEGQGLRLIAAEGVADAAAQGARLVAQGPFGIGVYHLPVSQSTDEIADRAVGYVGVAQELIPGAAVLDGLTP
jgi:hypothetical protein